MDAARGFVEQGFRCLKLKGGLDVDDHVDGLPAPRGVGRGGLANVGFVEPAVGMRKGGLDVAALQGQVVEIVEVVKLVQAVEIVRSRLEAAPTEKSLCSFL